MRVEELIVKKKRRCNTSKLNLRQSFIVLQVSRKGCVGIILFVGQTQRFSKGLDCAFDINIVTSWIRPFSCSLLSSEYLRTHSFLAFSITRTSAADCMTFESPTLALCPFSRAPCHAPMYGPPDKLDKRRFPFLCISI